MSKKMQKQNQFSVGDVGRILYEDPRGHMGCLNTKCHSYLWRSKEIQQRAIKTSQKIKHNLLIIRGFLNGERKEIIGGEI